jgi:translation initiation factor IF-2
MAKKRIYEIAKELGLPSKDVVAALEKLGVKGKTHSSSIEDDIAEKLLKSLKKAAPAKKKEPKKAKPAKAEAKPAKKAKPAKAEAKPVKAKAKPAKAEAKPVKAEAKPGKVKAKPEVKPAKKGKPPVAAAKPAKPAPRPAGKPQPKPGKPAFKPWKKRQQRATIGEMIEKPEVPSVPEDETEAKVPDKFKKALEDEKMEKFRTKPGMQRAFQAIRKIESRKFQPQFKKHGKGRHMPARPAKQQPTVTAPRKKSLKIQEGMTVKEFADLVGLKAPEVIKKFMDLGYMPTINQAVDIDAALLIADGMDIKLEVAPVEDVTAVEVTPEDESKLVHRPPIVTVMGHVDHGKTSLLDAIRKTRVIDTEAGGITQHIGAYKVTLKGKEIVFLDTPGHEAFTALRARGAKVTDIVILIVAADDGVKPQTIEAIDHAKAADVPIIVAINKIDKEGADPTRVRNELAEYNILPEDWGGQNIFTEISAKQRIGIENLLEMVLLQAEMMELKANPDKPAQGVIIEARLDKGKGPVATVLVQAGTLKVGDAFISGVNYGKVRALSNDAGKTIKDAGPATPAEVIGFSDVPNSGDTFAAVEDEKKARQVALARQQKQKAKEAVKMEKLSLDDVYKKIKEGQIKDLNIIVKGDVHGSVEAINDAFKGITHPEVKVNVIHSAVGGINESDVMLAAASSAIIIGFNVRPDMKASQAAEREGIDIRLYNVIYEAIEDVKKALEGMLEPTIKERVLGRAEVRQTFTASRLGTIAGSYVVDGIMSRACDGIRVIRDNIVIYEGKLGSLKRFKEDVKEVQTGYECGITVENFNDVKVGDVLENFVMEKVAAKL